MKVEQTIAVDWLQFNLSGFLHINHAEEFTELGNHRINGKTQSVVAKSWNRGTKHFTYVVDIIIDGEEFCQLEMIPRNDKIMQPETMVMRICNPWLYREGYINTFKTLLVALKLKFNHVVKVDIAVDSTKGELFKFVPAFQKGKIKLLGKANFHLMYKGGGNTVEYFRLGSSKSDKFIRGYYKREEIKKTGKQYIIDFWDVNGLDATKKVERLEISFKKKELDKYVDITLDQLELLEDATTLATLFRSGLQKFFQFIRVSEWKRKGNVSRCKRVFEVTLKNYGAQLLSKLIRTCNTELQRLKQASKTLFWCYMHTSHQAFLVMSKKMAESAEHAIWFRDKYPMWEKEFYMRKANKRFKFTSNLKQLAEGMQITIFEKNLV